jgi:hypothetical protein
MNFTAAVTALCDGYTIQRSDWSNNEYIDYSSDKIYKYIGSEKLEYEFSELDLMSTWNYKLEDDSWWKDDSWNDGY